MRLLVIEDNRNLVANLFDYFEPRGHALDAAPDGVTGLHLATTQAFDAVLLDWMLPRMDGREVLRRLREEHASTVPVIMLTARVVGRPLPSRSAAVGPAVCGGRGHRPAAGRRRRSVAG